MPKRVLLIGDIGDDNYFFSTCQKIFLSTPVFIKNTMQDVDVLLKAEDSDVIFIRIDQDYRYKVLLSCKIKTKIPRACVVWIAANSRYALPAFENNIDGYIELPITEAKIGAILKRL